MFVFWVCSLRVTTKAVEASLSTPTQRTGRGTAKRVWGASHEFEGKKYARPHDVHDQLAIAWLNPLHSPSRRPPRYWANTGGTQRVARYDHIQ